MLELYEWRQQGRQQQHAHLLETAPRRYFLHDTVYCTALKNDIQVKQNDFSNGNSVPTKVLHSSSHVTSARHGVTSPGALQQACLGTQRRAVSILPNIPGPTHQRLVMLHKASRKHAACPVSQISENTWLVQVSVLNTYNTRCSTAMVPQCTNLGASSMLCFTGT